MEQNHVKAIRHIERAIAAFGGNPIRCSHGPRSIPHSEAAALLWLFHVNSRNTQSRVQWDVVVPVNFKYEEPFQIEFENPGVSHDDLYASNDAFLRLKERSSGDVQLEVMVEEETTEDQGMRKIHCFISQVLEAIKDKYRQNITEFKISEVQTAS